MSSSHTHEWAGDISPREWWKMILCNAMENRKAMSFITMLVTWTIWKERKARVFNNKSALPTILLQIIKDEAKLWIVTGAKQLGFVIT
jgi:hypothetical protein